MPNPSRQLPLNVSGRRVIPIPPELLTPEAADIDPAAPIPHRIGLVGKCLDELDALAHAVSKRPSEAQPQCAELAQIIAYLRFPNMEIRQGVHAALQRLGEAPLEALRNAALGRGSPIAGSALLLLSALEARRPPGARAATLQMLEQLCATEAGPPPELFAALRFINTPAAHVLLLKLAEKHGEAALEQLGYCSGEDLIEPLNRVVRGNPEQMPLLGRALTAHWILKNLHMPLGRELAVAFGYLDPYCADLCRTNEGRQPVANLLRELGLAGRSLLFALRRSHDPARRIEHWRDEVQKLGWCLIPKEMSGRNAVGTAPADGSRNADVHRVLLFIALRELDRANLDAKREPKPFNRSTAALSPGHFLSCDQKRFEQGFLASARAHADKILRAATASSMVARQLLPYASFEFLALFSETRPEQAAQLRMMADARWRGIARMIECRAGVLRVAHPYRRLAGEVSRRLLSPGAEVGRRNLRALAGAGALPLARAAVSDERALRLAQVLLPRTARRSGVSLDSLSTGSRTCLRVAAYALAQRQPQRSLVQAELGEGLVRCADEERILRGRVPTLGIELQNNRPAPEVCEAWKQLLLGLGLPSPRRPEFYALVEAAVPPLWSPSALGMGVAGLAQCGYFNPAEGYLTLHFSLGANFGANAKFLGLGLWAFSAGRAEAADERAWLDGIAKVMSKGMIHLHPLSAHPCTGALRRSQRTEFRVCCLPPQASAAAAGEWIKTTAGRLQALAACSFAPPASARGAVWAAYQNGIQDLYGMPGYGAVALLNADWFECTGESRDAALVRELRMVQTLLGIRRHFCGQPSLREELFAQARAIFLTRGAQAWELIMRRK